MSKNSKNWRKTIQKRINRENKPGPKSTTPTHGKKKAWYQLGNSNNPKQRQSKKKDKEAEE